jgi:hypothetical protein
MGPEHIQHPVSGYGRSGVNGSASSSTEAEMGMPCLESLCIDADATARYVPLKNSRFYMKTTDIGSE